MSSAWTIELSAAARKDLEKIGHSNAKRIHKFLTERVANSNDPRRQGKALTGKEFDGLWRYRVGDYRVICEL